MQKRKERRMGFTEKKQSNRKRGEKWEQKTEKVQSLLLKSSSNFIWMLLCLPFSAQLCAHAHGSLRVLMFPSCVPPPNNISFKVTAKTFQPLPSHYFLCSPPPDHQNLPITRQRSTIKTYVYTTVSFMDQRVEKGGEAETGAQCQPCRAASYRGLLPLGFFFFFGAGYFAQLDQAENCKQCFYSTFFLSPLHKIKCVIWRHSENRSDKSSPQNTITV